jgi:hypothetical protein
MIEIEAWRIDSLDARAGIAFASWRFADLISGNIEPERATVFIAPPYFRPDALSNRAMGLSASRGQAQLGVFVQESELAFKTLDALSEFVRRVYQSSGGGDLPGGGGMGGRPRPPLKPEGGEPVIGEGAPEELGGGIGGAQSLVDVARLYYHICSRLNFTPGVPVQFENTVLSEASEGSGGGDDGGGATEGRETSTESDRADDSLLIGARELLFELVRRFPVHGKSTDILLWCESGTRLGEAIARLDLWRGIIDGPWRNILDQAGKRIDSTLSIGHPNRWALMAALMPQSLVLPEWYFLKMAPVPGINRIDSDPVDDLCAWPLPNDVSALIGSTLPNPSAFHLMGAICGSPIKLCSASATSAARAAAIVLFSAAHIVAETTCPVSSLWFNTERHCEALKAATEVTREWLMQQWPVMVFPQAVENVIGDGAKLAA